MKNLIALLILLAFASLSPVACSTAQERLNKRYPGFYSDENRQVDLASRELVSRDMPIVIQLLDELPNTKILNLDDNSIRVYGAMKLKALVAPSLEEFSMRYNQIEDDGIMHLSSALKKMTKLRRLDLRGNDFGESGLEELADAIANMPLLEELDLSRNSIGSEGIANIARAIEKAPRLRILQLQGNLIAMYRGGAEVLVQVLPKMEHLKLVNLASNRIRAPLALSLMEVMEQMPWCESFIIGDNDFSLQSLIAQAHKVGLALTFDQIVKYGGSFVLELIMRLDDRYNLMTDKILDLREMDLNNVAVVVLSQWLIRKGKDVKKLLLNKNSFGDFGLKLLADILPLLSELEYLDISDNLVTTTGQAAIMSVKKNMMPKLHTLILSPALKPNVNVKRSRFSRLRERFRIGR